jgi:hypothetical protein
MIASLVAWQGHSDASREVALDLTAAIDTHMERKAAAAVTGLHPADLSRQLAGRDPLNLWRLANLPAEVWMTFLTLRVKRMGGEVLTADQLDLLKGAAALGPRMLQALVPAVRKRA